MEPVSLCITTFQRLDLTLKSFARVIDDPRIAEIIIVDDHSDLDIYERLQRKLKAFPKVKIYRNARNLGMSLNKKRSIELASSQWCIVLDSDNRLDVNYLEALFLIREPRHECIYMPDAARPNFLFANFSGELIQVKNLAKMMSRRGFDVLINTCNYVVNRQRYLECYEPNPEMKGTDTAWFNYLWLKAGHSFYVVPKMQYLHRVHAGSGWLADADYNMNKAYQLRAMMTKL